MRYFAFLPLFCLLIAGILSDGCSKDKSKPKSNLPSVSTTHALISVYTAQITGNVTDSGGAAVTEVGACISNSTGPTITNSLVKTGSGYPQFYTYFTTLSPNTYYYVRAYAKNAYGTSYGGELSFLTLHNLKMPGKESADAK
jgi:hypothetical protein